MRVARSVLLRGGPETPCRKNRPHKRVFFWGRGGCAKPSGVNHEPQTPSSQAIALERFACITPIQDLVRQGFPLAVALEQVSLLPLNLPQGTQRLFAGAPRRTLAFADTLALPNGVVVNTYRPTTVSAP